MSGPGGKPWIRAPRRGCRRPGSLPRPEAPKLPARSSAAGSKRPTADVSAGRTVASEEALQVWEDRHRPQPETLIAVLGRLIGVTELGPPDDHLPVPLNEDLYVSRIGDTRLIATYLALGYERRIVIRRID